MYVPKRPANNIQIVKTCWDWFMFFSSFIFLLSCSVVFGFLFQHSNDLAKSSIARELWLFVGIVWGSKYLRTTSVELRYLFLLCNITIIGPLVYGVPTIKCHAKLSISTLVRSYGLIQWRWRRHTNSLNGRIIESRLFETQQSQTLSLSLRSFFLSLQTKPMWLNIVCWNRLGR